MSEAKDLNKDYSKYAFSDPEQHVFKTGKGLTEEVVREISKQKNEPEWMLNMRLRGLKHFQKRKMPKWGADLSEIDFDNIHYYLKPTEKQGDTWEDVPEYIKNTFNKLGIPEAEQKFLGGVGAQYDSDVIYHKIRDDLAAKGVVFLDMEGGIREYPEICKKYFGKIIPPEDNKFSALNTAVWSGGSFVYVPKGVHVELPLQAYFRINAQNMGQFERTLIVTEPGASVHYVEGCTAPVYSSDSLHAAVVELVALEDSKIRYTTIQNWSTNVYNLVTKRAFAYKNATVEWVDGNLGSKITMKYPAVYLLEEGARGDVLSVAFAGKNQLLDAGAKIVHAAPNTTSKIVNKSVSKDGGKTLYRGLLNVNKGAHNVKSSVICDALILDKDSASDTIPYMNINEKKVSIGHEASVGKVSEEQLFYLMSRGLDEEQAMTMIVSGFIEPFTKELPVEYAVELNKLIALSMEGSVG